MLKNQLSLHLSLVVLSLLPLGCGLKIGPGSSPVSPTAPYPLAVGRSWNYLAQSNSVGVSAICPVGTIVQTVSSSAPLDGVTTFNVPALCGTGSLQLGLDGDRVMSRYLNRWVTYVDAPPVDGNQWYAGTAHYSWIKSTSGITVGRQTYQGCWTRQQMDLGVNATAYDIFCPAVGIVLSHVSNTAGQVWEAQLQTKNF